MKKMILGLSLLAAALLAVSAAWTGATRGRWGRFEDYMCRETAKPFFLPAPADGGALVTQGRKGAQPFSFSMPKPEGVQRVFVIGESAAGLLARGGRDSFEEIYRAAAGTPVEIINCGMGAYDSSRIYGVFLEALACLAGSLLDEKCSELLSKYTSYKSITGNYSQEEIKAALQKRGVVPP